MNSAQPEDGDHTSREKSWRLTFSYESLILIMNSIGTAWIFGLMLLICVDIGMRFFFNRPISGVIEMVQISIVGIVYLQLAHALKVGRLTRSDVLFRAMLIRVPRVGHSLGILFNLAGAALMGLAAYGVWPRIFVAYEREHYVGNVGVFTFPEWPIWSLICVGCFSVAVQFWLLAWEHFMALFGRKATSIPTT